MAFIDMLWADWSPGYDATADLAWLKQSLADPANLAAALGYYRATLGAGYKDPALDAAQAATQAVPPQPTLYLHDLAVLPALAGQGLARALLMPIWHRAAGRGLGRSALVAVQGSQGFWERHGYAVQTLQEAQQRQRLATYGEGAVYMQRPLPGN